MRFAAAAALLCCVAIVPAAGQAAAGPPAAGSIPSVPGGTPPATPSVPDLSIPNDTATAWTLGFSVFTATGVGAQSAYLASSIPLLLRDQVSGIVTHTLTDAERDAARAALLGRARTAADLAVTAVRREHDALLFAGATPTDAQRAAAADRLSAALARRDFLAALDLSRIEVAAEKPVRMAQGTGDGKLLAEPRVPQAVYCARNGLDLLVGGSIREVQGYVIVDTWVYEAAGDRIIVSQREAAQREDLYGDLADMAVLLTGAIVGRPWTVVAFAPTPPQSSLAVDGTLVSSGSAPALYLVPGDRTITIAAPGYTPVTRTVTLAPGTTTRVDDTLAMAEPGSIALSSYPPGATLHLDSLWAGETPLVIPSPAQRSRGVLELDGYYPATTSLGPGSAAALTVILKPDEGPRDDLQKKARDRFYRSFGWFAASLPLPLFSYALVFDYYGRQQQFLARGLLDGAASSLQASQAFLVGYYGGVALSTGLFIWMVTRIVEYVTVANGIAG
jgi:hypothetical protein